jgi:peptidylprolyl isomerase
MKQLSLKLLAFFFIPILSFSQNKAFYKKTESGIKYRIIKKGNGTKCKKGLRIYINYSTKIKPDTIFDHNTGKPYAFILGQGEVLKGWDEGVSLLSVGDSAQFLIPPHLAYGEKKIGSIPANTTLELNVRIVNVEEAFFNLINKDTITYKSGLKKIIVESSKNEKVIPFNIVTVKFTGYFLSKEGYKLIFQSSQTNSDVAIFQLSVGKMIRGLDEGIATMNVNEKATFIVPPELGFGVNKNGLIPGNTTLFYDIEVINCTYPFYKTVNTDTIFTLSDVKVIPIIKKEGALIKTNNVVKFNSIGYFYTEKGNPIIFENTYETKVPNVLRPNLRSSFPGLSEGLTNLRQGEKAKIFVPAKLAFGNQGAGIIPPNKNLIYDIEILDVINYPFFETSNLDTMKLNSGLNYFQVRKTEGLQVDTGQKVSISYTGYTIDKYGNKDIFDASRESKKLLEFTVGKGKVIKGFDEGIKGMRVGEARTLIIPYELGYGKKGIPEVGIPAETTLYFDVELVSINNK